MDSENVKCDSESDKLETPSPKTKINKFYKQISRAVGGSPFRNLPNFSTPPSKSTVIKNPFEAHLIERLHLPTCSPNVFGQISTPKTEEKFKWTIDDISILKPADIDESTLSQHVVTLEDPHIESMVQEKITKFFSENKVVPSPLNVKVQQSICLVRESLGVTPEKYVNAEDRQCTEFMDDASLYKELFDIGDNEQNSADEVEVQSSLSPPAAISGDLGIPAMLFSPTTRGFGTPPELKDCAISPITRTLPLPTRFSFSDDMSIDISMIELADKDDLQMLTTCTPMKKADTTFGKNADCSMEYKQVSISFSSSCTDSDKMDISNSYTPRSKLFTRKKQRKRLSKSFRSELDGEDKNSSLQYEDNIYVEKGKMLENDATDVGYCTHDTGDYSNNCAHVFASTPSTKRNAILDF